MSHNHLRPMLAGFLLTALSFSALAQNSKAPKVSAVADIDQVACKKNDPIDSEEIPMRIVDTSMSFAGKCINTKKFRAARIVSQTETTITVANFLHNNVWWTATIPLSPEAWKAAYFQILRFPVVKGVEAAHTEMRMVTNPSTPIRLVSQHDPSVALTTESLIYSVEAAFPEEADYNFALGAFDNYPLDGRLFSAQQRLIESPTRGVEQYTLTFDKDLKQNQAAIAKLVLSAVNKSQEIGLNKFYNTIRPNCTTQAFDLLDQIHPRPAGVSPFLTVLSNDAIRGPSLDALEARGLSSRKAEVADMETEFPPYVSHQIVAAASSNIPGPLRDSKSIGMPMTLIAVMPRTATSPRLSQVLKKQVDLAFSKILQKLATAALAPAIVNRSAESVLVSMVNEVQKDIKESIMKINDQLPTEQNEVLLYYAPWSGAAQQISLAPYGIDALLPFKLVPNMSVDDATAAATIKQVSNNIQLFQTKEYNKKAAAPIFLLGAAVRMVLQKDRSTVNVQLAMSLVPSMLPFQTYSPAIDLNRVHLPAMGSLIVSNEQSYFQNIMTENLNQEVRLDFGGLNGISTNPKDKNYGMLGIKSGFSALNERPFLVPELQGKVIAQLGLLKRKKTEKFLGIDLDPAIDASYNILNSVPAEIDKLIKNRPMGIGIYSMKLVNGMSYCRDHGIKDDTPLNTFIHGTRISAKTIAICKEWNDATAASGEPAEITAVIEEVDARVRLEVNNNEIAEPIDFFHFVGNQIKNNGNESVDSQIHDEIAKIKPLILKTVTGAIPSSLRP